MTTKSKTPAKRSAAKRGNRTSTAARRSAKKRPARARATTARSAGDTTRKSAPKRRAQRPASRPAKAAKSNESNESTSMSSALRLAASGTRDALPEVPHTRTAIERELPRPRHRLYERAQMLTGMGRELLARARTMFSELTQQLHLPRLPGKRTA